MKRWVCVLEAIGSDKKGKRMSFDGSIYFEALDFWGANEYVRDFVKQKKLDVSFCKISERIME